MVKEKLTWRESIIIIPFTAICMILMLLFVFPIPSGDKDCLKPFEHDYITNCCKNASDIDGDGYITFEENNLRYGDFAMMHNAEMSGCSCSGFHQYRYCHTTNWKKYFKK